jgi:hypothetical protein
MLKQSPFKDEIATFVSLARNDKKKEKEEILTGSYEPSE